MTGIIYLIINTESKMYYFLILNIKYYVKYLERNPELITFHISFFYFQHR